MGGMRKTETFCLRLSPEELESIDRAAKLTGLSVSAYIRKCIELGGAVGAHKDLIEQIHKQLKAALLETLKKELPIARKKTA